MRCPRCRRRGGQHRLLRLARDGRNGGPSTWRRENRILQRGRATQTVPITQIRLAFAGQIATPRGRRCARRARKRGVLTRRGAACRNACRQRQDACGAGAAPCDCRGRGLLLSSGLLTFGSGCGSMPKCSSAQPGWNREGADRDAGNSRRGARQQRACLRAAWAEQRHTTGDGRSGGKRRGPVASGGGHVRPPARGKTRQQDVLTKHRPWRSRHVDVRWRSVGWRGK